MFSNNYFLAFWGNDAGTVQWKAPRRAAQRRAEHPRRRSRQRENRRLWHGPLSRTCRHGCACAGPAACVMAATWEGSPRACGGTRDACRRAAASFLLDVRPTTTMKL